MENFTIINEDKGNRTATMTLTGFISAYDGSNSFRAVTFLEKFNALVSKFDHVRINIVNLYGGSITEGIPIYNALKEVSTKSPEKLSGKIEGLAASMGQVISMGIPKEKLEQGNLARLMIHKARGGAFGTAEEMRASADNLESYEQDIVNILSDRTGLSADEVVAKWMDGKDHYIKGPEAKKLGLVGKIYESKIKDKLPSTIKTPQEVYSFFDSQLVLNQNSDINMELQKQLEQLLGVEGSDNVVASVKALTTEKGFKAKFEALETEVKTAQKAEADSLIAKLVDAKLIGEDTKPTYEALFASDHENAKKVVMSMLAKPAPAANAGAAESFIGEVVAGAGAASGKTTDQEKTYRWYEENNPQALLIMKEKEPEKYIALFNAQYPQ
ncbi:MAG: Clp protease ClpP [Bacteroidota bacterium]